MILVLNTCSAPLDRWFTDRSARPLFATLRVARANASQWDTPSKSLKGGLRDVWLKAWIQRAKALGKTVFIILDCCHSSNMSRGVGGEEEKEEDLVSSRCAIPPWLEQSPARSRGLLGDDEPAARWDSDEEIDCGWDLHTVANR